MSVSAVPIQEQFELLITTRRNILAAIDELSLAQINLIPYGFNNSIGWNVIHALVTQQLLMYGLSGLDFSIPPEWIASYRKGTKPESPIGPEMLTSIPELMRSTVAKGRSDYAGGVFVEFTPYETSFGTQLHSIEDAIRFNNIHESMHLGYVLAMKHMV